MLKLEGQRPIFIAIDAMDVCPNTTGSKSPRQKVLLFVEDIIRSRYPNLSICVTSSPEPDIKKTLNPLTSTHFRVNLHEEAGQAGQTEDIKNYIRSFVRSNEETQKWTRDNQDLFANSLLKQADGK
jgi:hypothetical protein